MTSPLRRIAHYAPATWISGKSGPDRNAIAGMCSRVRELGFDSVLYGGAGTDNMSRATTDGMVTGPAHAALVKACREEGLSLLTDICPPGDPAADAFHAWQDSVANDIDDGIAGVRCLGLDRLSPQQWGQFRQAIHRYRPDLLVMAWTPGMSHTQLHAFRSLGFDGCFSSLAWWDQHSPWLVHEFEALRRIAPVIASAVLPSGNGTVDPRRLADDGTVMQRLWVAAYLGQGVIMDVDRALAPSMAGTVRDVNRWQEGEYAHRGRLTLLSGLLSAGSILYWSGGAPYALVMHEPGEESFDAALRVLRARMPDGFVVTPEPVWQAGMRGRLISVLGVTRSVPVRARHVRADDGAVPSTYGNGRRCTMASPHSLKDAMGADRIVIEGVTPAVADGRFAVKLVLGTVLEVQATVFMDGHAPLGVSLLWRAADECRWQQVPMQPLGNDRWTGQCLPERLGRHYYTIQARVEDEELRHSTRQCPVFPVQVERREAEFSSWYELFPRSMGRPGEHGRFVDVIAQLSRIQDMGFDVLYFPPIHPVGATNRKGRNNALVAQPGDPGSPYAIGAESGGHDAVHPELGTLDDFRMLMAAARDHGIEIALDFAIQCSPDHPWLREHPEWFRWREDGTVQYAENPPKKYEDIVNPDFYSTTANARQRMSLWRALRDTVLFWAEQGVRMFRVDNPHTKPLPFWEWMIAEVNRHYPDAIFLSEAFTRPAMMHRLARLGFSQSYTYFTWRNTKAELTEYLTEVSSPSQLNYFRPHFFVNTPDINPYFLQSSGRGGFLVRAVMAATTSGLWGVYSGFELCEAQALPGREEYLDSEKYELRFRDWDQPGNIVAEITRLNVIRRSHPALQSHRGIRFHHVDDERILFFSRTTQEEDSIVLVAISLSPRDSLMTHIEMPVLNRAGGMRRPRRLRSLWDGRLQDVTGAALPLILTPEQPFVLWSVLS